MKEKIDIIKDRNDPASILLLKAMLAAKPSRGHMLEAFFEDQGIPYGPVVEVEMTINGVSVPIIETLNACWEAADKIQQEEVLKKAQELILESGLDKIRNALDNAERLVKDAIRETAFAKNLPPIDYEDEV